jgi:hypothetical protein
MDLLSYGSLPVSRLKVDDLVASRAEPFAFGALALLVSCVHACPPLQAMDVIQCTPRAPIQRNRCTPTRYPLWHHSQRYVAKMMLVAMTTATLMAI